MIRLILFTVLALIGAAVAFLLARDVEEEHDPAAILRAQQRAAFEATLAEAEGGDLKAQARVGDLLRLGRGSEKDPAAAARWYEKAAQAGHVGAQYMLGRIYDLGEGVPQDYARAARWYRRAGDLAGDREARYRLGILHFHGRGVPHDYDAAIAYYRKAANQGHPAAQYLLGVMREDGWGMKADLVRAFMWLTLAARQADKVRSYDPSYKVEKALERVRGRMNGFQIQRGEEAVHSWKPVRSLSPAGSGGR